MKRNNIARIAAAALCGLAFARAGASANSPHLPPPLANVVISEVSPAQGDYFPYVELFNRGTNDVSLGGWSLRFAEAGSASWQSYALSGTIKAGRPFLIKVGAGAGSVPPDATATLPLGLQRGKLLISQNTQAIASACPLGLVGVVDLLGYGAADCAEGQALPYGSGAMIRGDNGCLDSDRNASDFVVGLPTPRNSSQLRFVCNDIALAALGPPAYAPYTALHYELVIATGNDDASPYVISATLPAGLRFLGSDADDSSISGPHMVITKTSAARNQAIAVHVAALAESAAGPVVLHAEVAGAPGHSDVSLSNNFADSDAALPTALRTFLPAIAIQGSAVNPQPRRTEGPAADIAAGR